ncbi:FeoA family protein [Calothrix sp. PCC 6303]|uniref:FeoA family protein n=1 Tax=Calothrix sp. PCC 6303 TaxID=1170562 RepID=UPI0002A03DDE|nr:FeoA family protein [Calothrix sp. PCC 6303]AFZ00764.1 FeoA family protein [Calothrix sp. PCC 6303]
MTKIHHKQEQKSQNQLGKGFTYCGGTPETTKTEDSFGEKADVEEVQSFSLSLASVGERLKIAQIHASNSTLSQLSEMGLLPGAELEILNIINGSVIFSIANNRLGLGASMAQKVICTKY